MGVSEAASAQVLLFLLQACGSLKPAAQVELPLLSLQTVSEFMGAQQTAPQGRSFLRTGMGTELITVTAREMQSYIIDEVGGSELYKSP